MKKLVIVVVLMLELLVVGCGNNTTTAETDNSGNWQAVLTGGAGEASVLSFNTAFTVNGDGSLAVTSIQFLTVGTCFVSGATGSGTANVTTDATTGAISGTLTFVVQSGN